MLRKSGEQMLLDEVFGSRDASVRRDSIVAAMIVVFVCVAAAGVFLWSNGSFLATAAVLGTTLVVLVTLYRLDWGFYLLLLMVLVFGQFEVPGFDTFTFRVSYFKNLKEVYYLPYMSHGDANPFELHLLFVFAVWVALISIRRDVQVRRVALWFPALMWVLWIVVSFVYGLQKGGTFLPALWESRALMYLGAMYFFVAQIIRTRAQVKNMMWVCIAGITVKAYEGISRYISNGWSTEGYEAMQAHEDPVFITTLFFLLLGLAIFGGNRFQRRVLTVLLLPLLLGFYVGERRAAYAALIVSFAAFLVLIPYKNLLKALKYIIPVLVLVSIYLVVFWNSGSSIAGPIRQIKSGFEGAPSGEDVVKDRNYYSNLYRKIEDYDLAVTIQNHPVIGIGFGTKYEQPVELVTLDFALRDFMAHNNVIWLFVKVGAIGFFIFWFLMNSIAIRGASLLSRLRDPYLKVVCALIVIAVINQLTAAYFDLHLVRYRTMIYMGSLMGLLGNLRHMDEMERPAVVPVEGAETVAV